MKKISVKDLATVVGGADPTNRQCLIDGVITGALTGIGVLTGGLLGGAAGFFAGFQAANGNGCFG